MSVLPALPVFIPLLFAVITLTAWGRERFLRVISLIGVASLLAAAIGLYWVVRQNGSQVLQAGNWPAPAGITLVVDPFGAIMLVLSSLISLLIAVYAVAAIDQDRVMYGFYPLFFLLLAGVNGAFSTGDIFNLYVWFEVMLMASFVLLAMGRTREQLEGAIKYVILNLIASAFFLAAAGLTYNLAGTLNMADLVRQFQQVDNPGLVTVLAMLYLTAFGIKAAIFPFFFWLPASYHTPPVVVTALFSGLLTKVGVYALVRVFSLIFTNDPGFLQPILLVLSAVTMVTGVLGAAAQWDIRRLLSFHIISQIGYLIMGLALASELAFAGMVYFMIHVVIAKTALFLVAGIMHDVSGSYDLERMGGLYRARPWLAILFALPALSLAGLPPLPGFFAKLVLVRAGVADGQILIVGVALAVSMLTLFSMSKIWTEAFWKPEKSSLNEIRTSAWIWAPVISLAFLVLIVGLYAEPFLFASQQAAGQLIDSTGYSQAVFGGTP